MSFWLLLRSFLADYYRTPLNVGLLAMIPVFVIITIGERITGIAALLGRSVTLSEVQGLAALWSAALLAGVAGFFLLAGAQQADKRLVLAGNSALRVAAARLATAAFVAVLVSVVAFATLAMRTEIRNPLLALVAILVGALSYAALGALVGSIIRSDLEGSFAVLLIFNLDAITGSPLYGSESGWLKFLPLRFPARILMAEVGGKAHLSVHWAYSAAALIALASLVAVAFYRSARKV